MNMTWNNYILYLSSIPSTDGDKNNGASGSNTPPHEVKNAWDLF